MPVSFYATKSKPALQILLNQKETRNSETPAEKSLDYISCVNQAIDYVLLNLAEPLKLEVVAEAAGFSAFHFHRIFRSMVGESLNEFVKRVRLERSIVLLTQSVRSERKQKTLTEIALACGFSSSSDFSRCFKQRYDIAPSQFDVESFRNKQRESWQSTIEDPQQRYLLNRLEPGNNPDGFQVNLRQLPARTVAYLRVTDPYRPHAVSGAAANMLEWAEQKNLADGQWLGYMWDDPEVVSHQDCRYDVGLEVPVGFKNRLASNSNQSDTIVKQLGCFEFPAMLVAEVEVRGPIDLEMRAIDWLFGTWLPNSNHVPADLPSFEAWIGRPFEHGLEHFELMVQIPVRNH